MNIWGLCSVSRCGGVDVRINPLGWDGGKVFLGFGTESPRVFRSESPRVYRRGRCAPTLVKFGVKFPGPILTGAGLSLDPIEVTGSFGPVPVISMIRSFVGSEVSQRRLSKIRKVALRSMWPNEASDFTPWLADNLTGLGEALGIELETQERESPVGGRSLDIMATDRSGRAVIIENQLEDSDGDHLGRLLIYAAGKDADVIIWIARDFKDEHWQVLQWLNQRTGTQTKFFGVAIELWKIDDSRPAPYFRVVAAPNDWRKRNVVPRSQRKRYSEFRERLEEKLRLEPDLPLGPGRNPRNNPWLALNHVDGLHYSLDFPDRIYVSFQLKARGDRGLEWCHAAFDRLQGDKDRIEDKLGELEWVRRWQRTRGSTIICYYPEHFSDLTDSWAEVHRWIIQRYRLFREVFEPYRQELLAGPLSRVNRSS